MKATQHQEQEAIEIYKKSGQYGVYKYANSKGINEWSHCSPCEDETPDTWDSCCLVCGHNKN
jgi:hypothetical protein